MGCRVWVKGSSGDPTKGDWGNQDFIKRGWEKQGMKLTGEGGSLEPKRCQSWVRSWDSLLGGKGMGEDHSCRPQVVSERNCALGHSCHVTQKAKMLWDARDSRAGAVIDIMLGFIYCYSSTPL